MVAFFKAPGAFRKEKTIIQVMSQDCKDSLKRVVLSTQLLAFRYLPFQFNSFLPFKPPRQLSRPLLLQSQKRFKMLSRQEKPGESLWGSPRVSKGLLQLDAWSYSKKRSDETCVRS